MTIGNVKSAKRTLELFEMFALVQKPLSITEIANEMSMPQSSTSELVQSLVSLGYLDHDHETRTFYPTLRISLLSTWIHERSNHAGQLPALMNALYERTGESVSISMRNGIYTQYVLSQNPVVLNFKLDGSVRKPLACCASGWTLLSRESDAEIGRIIRRTIAETDVELWRDSARIAEAEIRSYRKRGYAYSSGHSGSDMAGIAVRLRDTDARMPLALVVAGPVERIAEKQDDIVNALGEFGLLPSHATVGRPSSVSDTR